MSKRELICGIIFIAAMIDIIGLTGSADMGALSFGEYTLRAVIRLAVMGITLLIGSDLWEELFPPKKKNRRP